MVCKKYLENQITSNELKLHIGYEGSSIPISKNDNRIALPTGCTIVYSQILFCRKGFG